MNGVDTPYPVVLDGVEFLGNDRVPILQVDHLRVEPGERLGISGPSGAGKSTLLYLLTGLLQSSTGSIRWGEVELGSLSARARDAFRRVHFGLIFQDFLLFEELSALDNASVGAGFAPADKREGIITRASELLKRLDVPLNNRGVDTFSGGERQRVAIARALATDPQVIVADEPTASLDYDTAVALMNDLLNLSSTGKTLIMVSHDRFVLESMDRVLRVENGKVGTGASI